MSFRNAPEKMPPLMGSSLSDGGDRPFSSASCNAPPTNSLKMFLYVRARTDTA
eukprot:CAMPEP_0171650034 /NCGR_PEP_ID=MMETSP0990-20121206/37283_1 /TAXON_ID=483369 /ORGANISM="non described non described, Strain CCMP2098" /LENGTH=52 /DNA_ID=CAMNT_0012228315 /DNA_START=26 /DNA_END=181 /DNA_ORIENTATION=-